MIERTTAAWSMSLNLGTVGKTHHWCELMFERAWFRQPTSISKEDRIGMLEPSFRAGTILFMMDRWYRMYDMHRSEAEGTSPKATRRARKRVRMDRDFVQDFLNDEHLVMTMAGYPPRPKAESRSDAHYI